MKKEYMAPEFELISLKMAFDTLTSSIESQQGEGIDYDLDNPGDEPIGDPIIL